MKSALWGLFIGGVVVAACTYEDNIESTSGSQVEPHEASCFQTDDSAISFESKGDKKYKRKPLKPQKVTVLTYDVLPPYAFRDRNEKLTGVYIEIAKTAFSRMPDYDILLKTVPWTRAKREIEKGRAFAILPPYFHAHDWLTEAKPHRPYIWPYSLPLYTQIDVIICNNDVLQKNRPVYPDDYQGLSFVMWRGDGRAGVAFRRLTRGRQIALQMVENVENTVKFLLLKRADCTIASRETFYWYLRRLKKTDGYKKHAREVVLQEAKTISRNQGYLGYTDINAETNYPFKKDFTIKFDIEIYKMRQSGEIEKIIDEFVPKETKDHTIPRCSCPSGA